MDFTESQLKLIYDAVRNYQITKVPPTTKLYQECSTILDTLFPIAKKNYIEPGYEVGN